VSSVNGTGNDAKPWAIVSSLLTDVFDGHSLSTEPAHGWHHALTDAMQAWADYEKPASQKEFWNFCSSLDWVANSIDVDVKARSEALVSTIPIQWPKTIELWASSAPVDGQSRLFAWRESRADLSVRAVRSIIGLLAKELREFGSELLVRDLIAHVHKKVFSEIATRAKWRSGALRPDFFEPPSTHQWVLTLAIHTGNPPPADVRSLMSHQVVKAGTSTHQVDHGKIFRPDNKRDMRNALRGRHSRARFCSRARGSSATARGPQFARRRRDWADRAVVQCA
jgi:hypothetical protein